MKKLTLYILLSATIIACGKKSGDAESSAGSDDLKLNQYIYAGKDLYIQHCSNCHQPEGQGLASLYPPLSGSDFLDGKMRELPCIIKNGLEGEITVNGKSFNQVMPANTRLTDLEIAEITTYIYNSWGRSEGILNVMEVNKIIPNCSKEEK
ncbi:c-type cytochrome [Fulvivirga ligni]|uniref:c-type cytochrome n=1 Tax=Fulvivirga ligni TaxID=2904246 RepID=UPI001F411DA7|nr:cytochrome c [Fulvivirga ligni]UII21747.1 cytochrome c [Fulvivirga ligni]